MDSFELSISPVFNEVIRAAEFVYEAPDDVTAKEDLLEALRNMAEFTQYLAASFQEALKVRPKTELSQRIPQEFSHELKSVTEVLSGLKTCLNDNKTDSFPSLIDQGRRALANMFEIFEQMKKEEESFPVFSKSPYIQEIVRIATGVAKGQYKPETLKDKVDWLRDRFLEFKDDFASIKEIPKENDDVEKLLPIAEQALQKMGAALDKMARFQRGYDKKLLKDGCSELLQSSEVLVAVQERLMKASVAQPSACPNCSALNPGGAKKCRSCGAALPAIIGLSTQTMEVKERTPVESKGPAYTYISRLEGSINSYKRKLLDEKDLKREIDFFSKKVSDGQVQFAEMKKKTAAQPQSSTESAQTLASLYNDMETGLNTLARGTAKLRSFFDSKDEQILDDGFDIIVAGATLMIETQNKIS
ncbi:MAG: hypothetical protein ACI376_04175 [Candidatus Bruticola sp.]